jgi:hypothetical protein
MMNFGGALRQESRQDKRLRLLLVGAGIVIISLAALAGFLFWKAQDSTEEGDNQAKSEHIIQRVGELFILPKEETPTVAEIQDLKKLEGQEFFSEAEDGDYVLIYSQAKVAFLYRESEDKLVNVGPIRTENDAAKQAPNNQQ